MKDAKGHGSNKRGGGVPIPGHEYHTKTDAQLRYIVKDASDAERATRGMSSYNPNSGAREDTAGKYSDQINNAASVLGYRARGGQQVVKDIAAQHGIPTAHLSMPASALDHETLKRIVSNPEAAKAVAGYGLHVPSSAEAEGVLRSRYDYSDKEISQLRGGK